MIYLSLCLPTNGISEWVFPVLDKIYQQKADINEWELIVTDNGNNVEFSKGMEKYALEHQNLIYQKNDAFLFGNQIEALKLAKGEYLKFLNHRSLLEEGALQWMINTIKECVDEKPVLYFSNGVMGYKSPYVSSEFDGFVKGLKEFASWTTGVGVWKTDFESIPSNWTYNSISPHSDVLFWVKDREKYIIDDTVWSHDIDESHARKGKYDLFRAFGIEEISITLDLLNKRAITPQTFKSVVKAYEKRVSGFYLQFVILKEPCSYILDGFNDAMGIFLNKRRVLLKAYSGLPKILIMKIYQKCFKTKSN